MQWSFRQLCGATDSYGTFRGAQGRNRTTDTCIFSAVLYRLSYLGTPAARAASL
jgi:hypothetical protein